MTVAGAKLRSFLAILALHVGRVVPSDHLIEALWGDSPPAAVRNGLQGLASKLRRTLGSADLVAMRNDGYVLELTPDHVDIGRFERRAAEGRALAAQGALLGPLKCWRRPTRSGEAIPSPISRTRSLRRGPSPGCPSRGLRSPRNGWTSSSSSAITTGRSFSSRGLSPPTPFARVCEGCSCSRCIAPGDRPTRCGSSRRGVSSWVRNWDSSPGLNCVGWSRRFSSTTQRWPHLSRRHQCHVRSPPSAPRASPRR